MRPRAEIHLLRRRPPCRTSDSRPDHKKKLGLPRVRHIEKGEGPMKLNHLRKTTCAVLGAIAVAGVLASSPAQAEGKKYRIALSNSFIGNEWRVEMINMLKAYVKKYHADEVELIINNSGPDVQKQIAAIDDMISQKVDAILIDPVSATALNPVIHEAVKAGIVVVDFDQSVTSKAPYKVTGDFIAMGAAHAQFLADTLGGKGNIILNRGVAGFEADADMYKGAVDVLKKYPDMHIVAEVYGHWDDGVSQAELTKALTAHPDVQGIINQAGEYGALQALINLKHPMIAMTGEGANGWRLAMLQYKDQGLKGISLGEPPMSSALALKVALDILKGRAPAEKDQSVPLPHVTTDNLKPGVNVFPGVAPSVFADISIPGSGIELTIDDAQGK
jgi:ribose transport system substrate-binding protein